MSEQLRIGVFQQDELFQVWGVEASRIGTFNTFIYAFVKERLDEFSLSFSHSRVFKIRFLVSKNNSRMKIFSATKLTYAYIFFLSSLNFTTKQEIQASSLQESNGANGGGFSNGEEQRTSGAGGYRQYGGETSSNSGSSGFGSNGFGSNNNIGGGGRQYSNGQASHHHNGGGYNNANNGMHHHHHRNAPRAGDWLCPNGCGNVYASKPQCFRCGVHKPEQAKVLSDADVPNNGRGNGFRHNSGFGFFNGNSQEFPTIATASAQQTSSQQQSTNGEGEETGDEGNDGTMENNINGTNTEGEQ